MSNLYEKNYDLNDHMGDFKKFKENYLLCVRKLSNLQEKYDNVQKDIKLAKEREVKKSELLLATQNACKEQLKIIDNLKLLTKEYNELKNEFEKKQQDNDNLIEKIKNLKIENDLHMESQAIEYENKLEKLKYDYETKLSDLQNELGLLVASYEIEKNQLEADNRELKEKYENEVSQLKMENNKLQATLVIFEKHKVNAEKKCTLLENEKSYYKSFQTKKSETSTKSCENYFKNISEPNNFDYPNNFNNLNLENSPSLQKDRQNLKNIPTVQETIKSNFDKFKHFKNITFTQTSSSENESNNPFSEPFESELNYTQFKNNPPKNQNQSDNFVKPVFKSLTKRKMCPYPESDFSSDSDSERNFVTPRNVQNFSRNFSRNQSNSRKTTPKPRSEKVFGSAINNPSNNNMMMPLPIIAGNLIQKSNSDNNEPKNFVNKKRKLYNPNNFDDLDEY